METTRRQFMVASAAGASVATIAAAGCAPSQPAGPTGCAAPNVGGPSPLPSPGSAGLIDETMFQARVSEYLLLATQNYSPADDGNVLAHLIRSRLDPSFTWDASLVPPSIVGSDPFRDTGDFAMMTYQWLWQFGRGVLPDATIAAIENTFVGFRYRYDDPLPAGAVDDKWYWSENHRGIFAVIEYLSGLAIPDRVFTFTGLTGAEHAARSRSRVIDWISERSRFGFSEWHSNTYMKYSWSPMLTLLEFAPDPELVTLAAGVLDMAMFDLAGHTLKGAFGVTHGRGYKGPKCDSTIETSFGTAKLLFNTTTESYRSLGDIGPLYLSGSSRYRLPEVIRLVAQADEVATVRERHGVALDPHEPITLLPEPAYGYTYDDPKNLPFWWSQGALTAWQLIPVTLAAAKRWNLFDEALFKQFSSLKTLLDVNPGLAQIAIRELAPFVAAGVLGEAHTYTWRSPEAMLSAVIDHRVGDAMEQCHAWQATLGPQAMVFTTHPSNPVPQTLDWGSDNGYWTGTASMPRSAQRHRAAIHIYHPSYESPNDPLLGPAFGYEPYTHAFFPQDRFDEIVEQAGWVFGRVGDGYVALYSERPATWRAAVAGKEATGGHTLPFDLVATGGADNVWLVEVGRKADHGSFAGFVSAISAATVEITRSGSSISARYVSPTEGDLRLGTSGGFTVDGVDTPLRDHPRHDSPWAQTCALEQGFDISKGGSRLRLNFATAGREVS